MTTEMGSAIKAWTGERTQDGMRPQVALKPSGREEASRTAVSEALSDAVVGGRGGGGGTRMGPQRAWQLTSAGPVASSCGSASQTA